MFIPREDIGRVDGAWREGDRAGLAGALAGGVRSLWIRLWEGGTDCVRPVGGVWRRPGGWVKGTNGCPSPATHPLGRPYCSGLRHNVPARNEEVAG